MYGLITDRTQENILRLTELSEKGFSNMTASEQEEWLGGNPLSAEGANLLPCGPYTSSAVELEFFNDAIIATATKAGTQLFAVVVIGGAADYLGKTITLSAEHISGGQVGLYWYDSNGYESAGVILTEGGKITATLSNNNSNRTQLAMFMYVTTSAEVSVGTQVRFNKVMFEFGAVQHEYVPYTEIIPTKATKGAYNYSDLNRVERTVAGISNTLGLGLVTKTDWQVWDIPRKADMDRYLNNIKTIRNSLSIEADIPETINKLDYNFANNIEMVLLAALTRSDYLYRSGELFLGEI